MYGKKKKYDVHTSDSIITTGAFVLRLPIRALERFPSGYSQMGLVHMTGAPIHPYKPRISRPGTSHFLPVALHNTRSGTWLLVQCLHLRASVILRRIRKGIVGITGCVEEHV
jgi:hypothetical protein